MRRVWLKVYVLSAFVIAFCTLPLFLNKTTYLNNVHVPDITVCRDILILTLSS
jgi:hypothetical protein